MSLIGVAVVALDNLPETRSDVRDLGRRHASYSVKDDHYDVVAEALLWTLEKGLGESFTDEVQEAGRARTSFWQTQ